MLFSNILAAGLAQAMTASAATMMVTVAANNKFQFTPNSVTAQPGDMVAFNFVAQVSIRSTILQNTANISEPLGRFLHCQQPLPA